MKKQISDSIYKITNIITGKEFFSRRQTVHEVKTKRMHERYSPHPELKNDIKKFGWENFNFEIIGIYTKCGEAEKELTKIRNASRQKGNCYNKTMSSIERQKDNLK